MERQQQNFLEIVKSAVHHTPLCLNEPVDYNAILELAREQNLLALVCEKLCESGEFLASEALDIYLFGDMYREKINWAYIQKCLRETESEKFFTDLLFLGNHYLGYGFNIHEKPNCPEDLLADILENGVFGNSTQAEVTAHCLTVAAINQRENYTTSRSLLRTIFPNIEVMRVGNPELVEKPWLLPLCWVKRWGRFIRHNKENGGNLAQESIRISQRRIALLKKYGIIR